MFFTGGFVEQVTIVQMDFQDIIGTDLIGQTILAFQGDDITAVDTVAEKNSGVELGDDALNARFS